MRFMNSRWFAALASMAVLAAGCSDGTGPSHPELVISTTSLPAAMAGEPYSEGVSAEGGDGEYEWEVVSGELPAGLSLSVEDLPANDVVITGVPESEGTFTFTVEVRSGDGQAAGAELTLEVMPPANALRIESPFLPPAIAGAPYDVTLLAAGGTGDVTWRLVSGSLPDGMTLNGADVEGTPTSPDTSTFTVEAVRGDEAHQATFTLTVIEDAPGSYDITIVEVAPVPGPIRSSLRDAIAEWETAITGDLVGGLIGKNFFPSGSCGGFGRFTNGAVVEDILIIVNITSIDGPGDVLGQAGPCAIRSEGSLTLVGLLTLDADDLELLSTPAAGESMMFIISHEIAHVLGFGSLWEDLELITGAGTTTPLFTGSEAVREWQALGGSGDVPVENSGGEGTADVHWEESELNSERMTGFVEQPGLDQPLSRVSLAAMADLGYAVDLDAADPFVLPAILDLGTAHDHLGYDIVLDEPLLVARPDGTAYQRRPR